MADRAASVILPRSAKAPAAARDAIGLLTADLSTEARSDAHLLVSELAANAVRHGEGRIELRAELLGGRLHVDMVDEGHGFDSRPSRKRSGTGGHGLRILEHLADRWGVYEGTTHVWFEMEVR